MASISIMTRSAHLASRGWCALRTASNDIVNIFNRYNSQTKRCENASGKGTALLVGAGPGDPGLLTMHAFNAMRAADVVLIDSLVSEQIVDLLPTNVEQRYVGKRAGHHSMSQSAICELMVEYALAGKCVVRLKGGDPAIFGRTAEEVNALEDAGIEYAIVPGITAASAASAYSGIPLTMRGAAQSVRLITAHMQDPAKQPDWRVLSKGLHDQTLVFYMGLGRLDAIIAGLVDAGMAQNMPVAVIDKASTPEQQVICANADVIVETVNSNQITGPSLIVIGKTVSHQFSVTPELLRQINQSTGVFV